MNSGQEFWALQDVSFEVGPGHALGIIGPNGAGKSTTLKLLTKILRPTRGGCAIRGRVGALIEVAANNLTGTAPTVEITEDTPGVTAFARGLLPGGEVVNTFDGVRYVNAGTSSNAPDYDAVTVA